MTPPGIYDKDWAGYLDGDILPTVRSLPYYGTLPLGYEREVARALRRDTLPLLSRRLPWHHLCGLPLPEPPGEAWQREPRTTPERRQQTLERTFGAVHRF